MILKKISGNEILAIGIDIGGDIKLCCGDIRKALPNIIGNTNPAGWSEITTDKSWINNLILMENNEEFYIGELARTQSEIKHFIGESSSLQKINEIFLIIKAALPLISNETDQNIILGIGVPVSTSIEKMKELSSKLKGEFEIKIKNEATKEIIQVKKNIKKVFVMPESYGSYYKIVSNFNDNTAIDAVVISLDIITEILTIYDGRLIRNASRNLTGASLSTLANKIAGALQKQTNSIIHPNTILKNIRNNENLVSIAGKPYDITKVKEYYIRQIAAEIVENLVELLTTLPLEAKIQYYIITGEAQELFWYEIEMIIYEKSLINDFDFDRVIKVKDPAFSNAIGFELLSKKKLEFENK